MGLLQKTCCPFVIWGVIPTLSTWGAVGPGTLIRGEVLVYVLLLHLETRTAVPRMCWWGSALRRQVGSAGEHRLEQAREVVSAHDGPRGGGPLGTQT